MQSQGVVAAKARATKCGVDREIDFEKRI